MWIMHSAAVTCALHCIFILSCKFILSYYNVDSNMNKKQDHTTKITIIKHKILMKETLQVATIRIAEAVGTIIQEKD